MNFEIDNETKVIALLSGYASDLGKGKDFENTTYALAEQITKMFDKEKESYHQSKIDAITGDAVAVSAQKEVSKLANMADDSFLIGFSLGYNEGAVFFKQELKK